MSHTTSHAYSLNTTPLGYDHLEEQSGRRTKGRASYYWDDSYHFVYDTVKTFLQSILKGKTDLF